MDAGSAHTPVCGSIAVSAAGTIIARAGRSMAAVWPQYGYSVEGRPTDLGFLQPKG